MSMIYLVTVGESTLITNQLEVEEHNDFFNQRIVLQGDFLELGTMSLSFDQHKWHDALIINAGTEFHVQVVEQRSPLVSDFENAVNCKAVGRMVGAIKGLAETFINENLSSDIKDILKKTPAAIPTVTKMLQNGISAALDALKKDNK